MVRLLLPILLLAGCQGALPESAQHPAGAEKLQGATLVLNRTLTLLDHQTALHIQDGRFVPRYQLLAARPWCRLEPHEISGETRRFEPGVFLITRVARIEGEASTVFALHSEGEPRIRRLVCHRAGQGAIDVDELRTALGDICTLRAAG
jgi:hypothetical protein